MSVITMSGCNFSTNSNAFTPFVALPTICKPNCSHNIRLFIASITSSNVFVVATTFGIYIVPISKFFITLSNPPMWSSCG